MYICICICRCVCVCVHVYDMYVKLVCVITPKCARICICVCTCVCICMWVYVDVYVYVCGCMYIHNVCIFPNSCDSSDKGSHGGQKKSNIESKVTLQILSTVDPTGTNIGAQKYQPNNVTSIVRTGRFVRPDHRTAVTTR